MRYEGGYSNVWGDTGGETKYGISHKAYPNIDIVHLTKEQAEVIYKRDYWDKICGDFLRQPLALTLFDFAVNSGVDRVTREVQKTLGLRCDGIFGSKTLMTLQDLDDKEAKDLVDKINDTRLQLYVNLASNPTQRRFLLGWLRRLMALQREV